LGASMLGGYAAYGRWSLYRSKKIERAKHEIQEWQRAAKKARQVSRPERKNGIAEKVTTPEHSLPYTDKGRERIG